MIIQIINIVRAVLKAKDNTSVRPYRHGPKSLQHTFQGMQAKAWQVHMFNGRRSVQGRQNIPPFLDMLRVHDARIVIIKQPLQSFVRKLLIT